MIDRHKPWIVCAACRNSKTGLIVTGARHFDRIMRDTINAMMPAHMDQLDYWKEGWSDADQGFIDQRGNYYDRDEAYAIAEANGQIREHLDCRGLFSENLY